MFNKNYFNMLNIYNLALFNMLKFYIDLFIKHVYNMLNNTQGRSD